ncbi:hypothetical protein N9B94_01720 [Verrucomicrobia bacterium]|nr:hypothetical protein [Verrucomicrobiota bacterium]
MKFDELKVIWDSQTNEPLYAIDHDAMHQSIRREGKDIQKVLTIFEAMSMLILFTLGIVIGSEPFFEGHDYHQYIDATVYIAIGSYLAMEFRRRRREGAAFDDSLLGDLDRAIFHVNTQIRRFSIFPFFVVGPMAILCLAKLPMYYASKPMWLWPMMALCFFGTWHALRNDVKKTHIPRKESLIALREKITSKPE